MPPNIDNQVIYFCGGHIKFYTFIKKDNQYAMNLLNKFAFFMTDKFIFPVNNTTIAQLFPNVSSESHILFQIRNTNINKIMMNTNILNYCSIIKHISAQEQYKFTLNDKSSITVDCIGIGLSIHDKILHNSYSMHYDGAQYYIKYGKPYCVKKINKKKTILDYFNAQNQPESQEVKTVLDQIDHFMKTNKKNMFEEPLELEMIDLVSVDVIHITI
jgi:hypothetical protein